MEKPKVETNHFTSIAEMEKWMAGRDPNEPYHITFKIEPPATNWLEKTLEAARKNIAAFTGKSA